MTTERRTDSSGNTRQAAQGNGGGCFRWAGTFVLVGLGALLLAVAVVSYGVYRQGEEFLTRAETLFRQPQPTPALDTRAVVVQQLRDVSELTTATFVMETVVSQSQDRVIGPFTVGETRLLYVAYGEARAGVMLDELSADDVEVVSDTITVHLPPPTLLHTSIDVDRSYVYDLQRSVLGPVDPDMQSRAEQYALRKIETAACESGILEKANQNADRTVRALMEAAGFETVRVETQPPAAECVALPDDED